MLSGSIWVAPRSANCRGRDQLTWNELMNQSYPVPPPELVQQWIKDCDNPEKPRWQEYEQDIATLAAQWGADQELEACCSEMDGWGDIHYSAGWKFSKNLRTARRPRPPSLKEQALAVLKNSPVDPEDETLQLSADAELIIRRALEALDG